MTTPENYWALLLGKPESFALTVGPFLSNREIFQLSAASRGVLNLRYALGRWTVQLDRTLYKAFCTKRHSVPVCFAGQDTQDFDLVTVLGDRLKIVVRNPPGCRRIYDVSALAGVHSLDLTDCIYITDVSALGGVHTLDLTGCRGIRDVSALGGVHTLILTCNRLQHLQHPCYMSARGGVLRTLFRGCAGVTDVSALGSVHSLDLTDCIYITDVSALGGLHTLNLTGCRSITDVSALGGVHTLILPRHLRRRGIGHS
jgi:hypothetical protein